MGGIGSALIGAVGGIGDEIHDFVDSLTNYAKKSMDASGEDFKKVDRVLDGNISINEAILGMAKGTNGHIQDARDRIKEIAASATTSTTELANYATEDLKGKSAEFSTGISEIQRLNNDRARTSSAIFIAKVVETNIIGQGIMKYMSTTTVGLIIQLVQVAIDKINSMSSDSDTNTNTNSAPPVTNNNGNSSSSYIITNNFTNQQKGSQVTFDYEDQKFWV